MESTIVIVVAIARDEGYHDDEDQASERGAELELVEGRRFIANGNPAYR